ncbi:Coenzyme F420 hydrogenase/dehydrogenase, beta subunit C-terminal domain [Myroides sp. LJL119]
MVEIKDIIQADLCVGCGMCLSESVGGEMIWDDNGFLVPDFRNVFNEKAIKLCPFNPSPDEEVKDEDKIAKLFLTDAVQQDELIGKYSQLYVGFSTKYREQSSSGGIATYVFEQLLTQKIVDHIYVVKELNGSYGYQLVSSVESIRKISKTRYIPVSLAGLFSAIKAVEGRIALSGVACFIKAVRLKQHYDPAFREKTPFLIGIICGGLKSNFFTDYLAKRAGIAGEYVKQEYRIKNPHGTASDYSFGAYSKDNLNKMKTTRMQLLGDMWGSGLFKANACDFCTDVTTELADISLGDAWLEPYSQDGLGTSVIVARSLKANDIIRKGIKNKELEVEILTLERFKASQQGSFNHRQKGLKYRYKYLTNSSIAPSIRTRFFEDISFDFRIVQRLRLKLRKKSFKVWKKHNNPELFEQALSRDRTILRRSSLLNHRIRKVKKLLGF